MATTAAGTPAEPAAASYTLASAIERIGQLEIEVTTLRVELTETNAKLHSSHARENLLRVAIEDDQSTLASVRARLASVAAGMDADAAGEGDASKSHERHASTSSV